MAIVNSQNNSEKQSNNNDTQQTTLKAEIISAIPRLIIDTIEEYLDFNDIPLKEVTKRLDISPIFFVKILELSTLKNELTTDEIRWLSLLKKISDFDHIPESLEEPEREEIRLLVYNILSSDSKIKK